MKYIIRRSRLSLILTAAMAGFILLLCGFAVVRQVSAASEQQVTPGMRLITLYDRGIETVFATDAKTIRGALEKANVALDERDTVEPSLDEELVAEEYTVNIYRARPILVVDGAVRMRIMTSAQTASQIAKNADITLYEEDTTKIVRSDNVLADGAGLQLVISRATPVNVLLFGKETVLRTQAKTVGAMLKEKAVSLGANDRVSVPLDTPISPDLSFRIWREGRQTITVEESVAFETEKIQDANRSVDYRQVQTQGENGTKDVTYEVVIQDGKEVGRKEIASVVTKEPKKQVEVVGTKNNYSGSVNEWLAALRSCEAGGRYTANTGNGFYGAYQFMESTWNSIATKVGRPDLVGVRPDLANPADQDMMIIANTKLSRGGLATQNPGCYRKLGLSQFPPE